MLHYCIYRHSWISENRIFTELYNKINNLINFYIRGLEFKQIILLKIIFVNRCIFFSLFKVNNKNAQGYLFFQNSSFTSHEDKSH